MSLLASGSLLPGSTERHSYSSISCPVRGPVESVVTLLEADDDARGTAARADSVSTRSGQDVMAAAVVPAHQIGLDGLLTEYSGHRILSVRSRDVAMGVDLR